VSEFLVSLANGKSFCANGQISLLDAALAAGLNLEHGCRTGRCGQCKTHVLQGRTQRIAADLCLSDAERSQGWVLTCADAAGSDVALESEDLAELEGITARTLPARIHELQPLSEDVLRVVLRLPPRSGLRYLAGQYVNIIGAGGLRRSYSMANAPQGDDRLEFFIRRVPGGEMSDYWFQRAALGDLLRIDGPRGSFYLRQPAGRDLVLLATGTGIAPIKAMLETLASAQPRSVRLLWGGRTRSDLFWKPAFADLPLKFTPVLSRAGSDWSGARGHVQQVLLQGKPDLAQTDVYACGSSAMLASAQAALLAAGLPAQRFHADAFVSSASPAEPGAKREQRPQPQAETTTS
jgi:CDP-4-dehydro-6-deoxyglucose reductase